MATIIDYRGKSPDKTPFGVPLITAKIVKGGRIAKPSEFIAEEDYDEWMRRGLPEPGDVVMTTEAPLGEIAQLDRRKVALAQRLITLRGRPGFLDSNFLKFLMQSDFVQAQLKARATGTTVLGIKQSELRKVELLIPPFPEQQAIAELLGAIDDKIELNHQMNETLEASAQALFKSWFIDFDPVRTKAAGHTPPGMDPVTAALFPRTLKDTELGPIPLDWEVRKISEFATLEKGLSYKGQFLGDTGLPMVNLGCFKGGGRFDDASLKFYHGEYHPRHTVKPRDLVMANTDITQKREVLGSPAIVPPSPYGDTFLFTHHTFGFRFQASQQLWKLFVYYSLLREGFRERATGFATGTTVLALPRDAVLNFEFPAPPDELAIAFNSHVTPLMERAWLNHDESRSIATARDILLPKLLSGEIRVPLD
jgi:type I restriction enzyme S subunit